VLENREERSIEEAVEKSVQVNDDPGQLSTSFESSFPQIISLRSGLTGDSRVSRLQSFDAEGAAESSNVTVRRKGKGKKSVEFDRLPATGQTSLDVTEIQTGLKEIRSSRDIESVDLDEANILEEKRAKKLINKYVQVV
jgi:hypothetical protein